MEYYRPPYRSRGPISTFFSNTPDGCRGLIVACVAVFGLQWVVWLGSSEGDMYELLLRYFGLNAYLFVHGCLYQAVTYLFLHGDIWHIGFNMLTLWMFGCEMERFWGTRRFLRYYAVCGVGAALATVAIGPFSPPPLAPLPAPKTIGASGAILGVVLAYGLTFPERIILFNFFIPMRAKYFLIVIIAMQVLFFRSYMASGVAAIAHLGGMLFGYLYLKRVWRVRALLEEIRWRLRRRRFRLIGRGRDRDSYPFH